MVAPGLVMFWFGADLFFANVGFFIAEVRRLIRQSPTPIRWLVVDARAITDVDFSASRALSEFRRDLADNRIALALIVVSTQHRDQLEESGLIDLAEVTRIFDSRETCITAYLAECAADEKRGIDA